MTHSTTEKSAGLRTKYRCLRLTEPGELLPRVALVCEGWRSKPITGPEALAILRAVSARIAASHSRAVLEVEFPRELDGLYTVAKTIPSVRAMLEGEVHHG